MLKAISYEIVLSDSKVQTTLESVTATKGNLVSAKVESAIAEPIINEDGSKMVSADLRFDLAKDAAAIKSAIEAIKATSPKGSYTTHDCNHDSGKPCDASTVKTVTWSDELEMPIAKEILPVDELPIDEKPIEEILPKEGETIAIK